MAFFSADSRAAALQRLAVQNEVLVAIQRGELVARFRPEVDLGEGRVVGVEAVADWRDPELGLLGSELVRGAAAAGLTRALGASLLRTACEEASRWRKAEHELRLSVRIGSEDVEGEDFVETVLRCLREAELSPERLQLELSEATVMRNSGSAAATVHALRDHGVRVCIADFGVHAPPSSLLREVPADGVKLGSEFVAAAVQQERGRSVARMLVELARSLSLEIGAEGVDSTDQMEAVLSLGCSRMQGALFSPWLSAADLVQFLASRQAAWEGRGDLEDGRF
jgi:EAL domain-containing protein (putative c-di-GMP-specific phosphodiesterase class I)